MFFLNIRLRRSESKKMDLFVTQDHARQRTGGLFTLLAFMLIGVVGLVHTLVLLATGGAVGNVEAHWRLFPWTIPASVLVLAIGVIVRFYAIRLGGGQVALELGGRRVHPAASAPGDRLILEIVEELALASGISMPEVWILDRERSINAFAAGDEPSRAVIGVTRGALERLTPDELRAVLAHEFSHVLNGDMKLNFQLLAWVQGILFLGLIGRSMLNSDGAIKRRKTGARADASLEEGQTLSVLGILLMLFGCFSSVFGRLLQGAICREHEFVADAAAVSLTGSPEYLVRALRKIGGLRDGFLLESPAAPEVGHLFFVEAAVGLTSWLFPTHPSVEERIRRLDPEWSGEFLQSKVGQVREEPEADPIDSMEAAQALAEISESNIKDAQDETLAGFVKDLLKVRREASYASAALDKIGEVFSWNQVVQAQADKKTLRPDWLALTLSRDGVKQLMLEIVQPEYVKGRLLADATPVQTMMLYDLAMPLLRRMSIDEFVSLNKRIRKEVRRGEETDLLRYMFAFSFTRRMQLCLGLREAPAVLIEEFPSIWEETQKLVSVMSSIGAPTLHARVAAYSAAWSELGVEIPPLLHHVSLLDLGRTLDVCAQAAPLLKKRVLTACGLAASYEGRISEQEMVILRLFADSIGCPVPNLTGGKC
jgi:Zn-dependent protease with chaperone function